MAASTKTLQLKIVSSIEGKDVLNSLNKDLQAVNTSLKKFTTATTIADDGTKKFIHSMEVEGTAARALEQSIKKVNKSKLEGSNTTTKQILLNEKSSSQIRKLLERERLEKAQSSSKRLLAITNDEVKLKKLIIENGAKSILVVREKQAQKVKAIQVRLSKELADIDRNFAKGTLGSGVGSKRNAALTRYKKELQIVNRETDQANKRHKLQQLAISEAQKKHNAELKETNRQYRNINSAIGKVKRGHRSWSRQIAEGIGLYRAISLAISGISRAILAIPKIGIERQTTEAVFSATLGSSAASAAAFTAIRKEAERTGIAISTLRETFRNLNASMSLAGETTQTVFKVFTDINTVSTALHLSADKTSAIFLALAQIFNKTKVQSEELVKQLGNLLPGAFASFQKANEDQFKSTQELIKQMSLGTVFAHRTVVNFTDFLANRFSKGFNLATLGLQASLGRLNTGFTLLGEAIFKVVKGPMTDLINSLAFIAKGLAGAIEGTNAFSLVLKGALVIAISLVGTGLINLGKGLLVYETAAIAATATTKAFAATTVFGLEAITARIGLLKAALLFFVKGPGVIIAALATAALAMSQIGKDARDASKFVKDLRDKLNEIAKIKELPKLEIIIANSENIKALDENIQKIKDSLKGIGLDREFSTRINVVILAKRKQLNKDLLFLQEQRADEVANITAQQAEADLKAKKNEAKLEADIVRQKEKKLASIAKSARDTRQAISSIETKTEIAKLKANLGTSITELTRFYKKKKELLIADVQSRLKLVGDTVNFTDASNDPKAFNKAQVDVASLKAELASIKLDISAESFSAINSRIKEIADSTEQAKQANEAYKASVVQTKIILLNLQGKTLEASKEQILVERDLAIASIDMSRAGAASQEKTINSIALINLGIAESTDLTTRQGEATAKLATQRELINARVSAGVITDIQGFDRLQQKRKEALVTLEQTLEASIQLAGVNPGKALADSFDKSRQSIALLKLQIKGTKKPLTDFERLAKDIGQSTQDAFANSFADFISGTATAKEAITSFADTVLKQISRIAANKATEAILGLVVTGASALLGNLLGPSASPAFGDGVAGGNSAGFSDLIQNAFVQPKSSIFASSGVTPFASGGVVDSPTVFPFARGTGLMGEKGPEAILPLKRDKSGNLGVTSSGSPGATGTSGIVIQNMNVYVEQAGDETPEEQAKDIGRAIKEQLKVMITSELANSKRSGGLLNPTQLQASF